MRKSLLFAFSLTLAPCFAQMTGGHETVQDAIRFERQKDAAAARQARMESRQSRGASAERSAESPKPAKRHKTKSGSAR